MRAETAAEPAAAAAAAAAAGPAAAERARAQAANEAAMRDVLELRHLSLASSGVGTGEEDVDPDYTCPICLVRLP